MLDQPNALLVVEKGVPGVSTIPLERQVYLLGRSSTADISVDSPYISRRHAQIVLQDGRYQLQDLGSKNGTLINGQFLQGEGRWLQSGDRIELAHGEIVLRFQYSGATATLSAIPSSSSDDLMVDAKSREVWVQGNKLAPPLSRKEFDILNLLYQRRGEACSKNDIAAAGWPERTETAVGDAEIEQYIRLLRRKIEPDARRHQYILTVRGYGYKLSLR